MIRRHSSKYRDSSSRTSSWSRTSERLVKPTRSPNSTLVTRRDATGCEAAAGRRRAGPGRLRSWSRTGRPARSRSSRRCTPRPAGWRRRRSRTWPRRAVPRHHAVQVVTVASSTLPRGRARMPQDPALRGRTAEFPHPPGPWLRWHHERSLRPAALAGAGPPEPAAAAVRQHPTALRPAALRPAALRPAAVRRPAAARLPRRAVRPGARPGRPHARRAHLGRRRPLERADRRLRGDGVPRPAAGAARQGQRVAPTSAPRRSSR